MVFVGKLITICQLIRGVVTLCILLLVKLLLADFLSFESLVQLVVLNLQSLDVLVQYLYKVVLAGIDVGVLVALFAVLSH